MLQIHFEDNRIDVPEPLAFGLYEPSDEAPIPVDQLPDGVIDAELRLWFGDSSLCLRGSTQAAIAWVEELGRKFADSSSISRFVDDRHYRLAEGWVFDEVDGIPSGETYFLRFKVDRLSEESHFVVCRHCGGGRQGAEVFRSGEVLMLTDSLALHDDRMCTRGQCGHWRVCGSLERSLTALHGQIARVISPGLARSFPVTTGILPALLDATRLTEVAAAIRKLREVRDGLASELRLALRGLFRLGNMS